MSHLTFLISSFAQRYSYMYSQAAGRNYPQIFIIYYYYT